VILKDLCQTQYIPRAFKLLKADAIFNSFKESEEYWMSPQGPEDIPVGGRFSDHVTSIPSYLRKFEGMLMQALMPLGAYLPPSGFSIISSTTKTVVQDMHIDYLAMMSGQVTEFLPLIFLVALGPSCSVIVGGKIIRLGTGDVFLAQGNIVHQGAGFSECQSPRFHGFVETRQFSSSDSNGFIDESFYLKTGQYLPRVGTYCPNYTPKKLGVANIGNSCFLGVIFQFIRHTEPFYVRICETSKRFDNWGKRKGRKQNPKFFIEMLHHLFELMEEESLLASSVRDLLNYLYDILNIPRLIFQDPGLIMLKILQLLQADCISIHKSVTGCQQQEEILEILEIVEIRVERSSLHVMYSILLPVTEQLLPMADQWDLYFKEHLDPPQKMVTKISSFPIVLIVQYKRFEVDYFGQIQKKVNPVQFDEFIKFAEMPKSSILEAKPIYLLYGIVCHIGPTLNKGHCKSYFRNVFNDAHDVDNMWYYFNDDEVTPANVDVKNLPNCIKNNAYILFYRRIDVESARRKWLK
jgi:ubiquitin C-terminal hydrolase